MLLPSKSNAITHQKHCFYIPTLHHPLSKALPQNKNCATNFLATQSFYLFISFHSPSFLALIIKHTPCLYNKTISLLARRQRTNISKLAYQ